MKRHSMAIYVSDNAVNFGKQKLDVGMEKIKEKCYSYEVVQKISIYVLFKTKNDTSNKCFDIFKDFPCFSFQSTFQTRERIIQTEKVFQKAYLLFLIPFHKHNTSVDRPLTRISQRQV